MQVYLQSRSKRWLGVLRRVRPELRLAKRNVTMYVEAARRMPDAGVRVRSERDQQVMTVLARDLIALTFEGQRLGSDSWLEDTLQDVSLGLNEFAFGDGFLSSLDILDSAVESAISLLQERITEPGPSIDEMERAFLISLVVTLKSHNVLLQKVSAWEQPHQQFLQGHLPTDVGHYFDVKTLSYVDTGGPGRIHVALADHASRPVALRLQPGPRSVLAGHQRTSCGISPDQP